MDRTLFERKLIFFRVYVDLANRYKESKPNVTGAFCCNGRWPQRLWFNMLYVRPM